jgi:hypothetical protein
VGVQTGESFNIMLPDRYYHRLFSVFASTCLLIFPKTSTISMELLLFNVMQQSVRFYSHKKQPAQNLTLSAALAR